MKRHRFACLAKRRAAHRAFAANKSAAPVQLDQSINKLPASKSQDKKPEGEAHSSVLNATEPLRLGAYPKRCAGCNRRFMYTLNFYKHAKICSKIDRSKPITAQVVLSNKAAAIETTAETESKTNSSVGETGRPSSTLRKRQPPASFNNYTMEPKRKRAQVISLSETIRKDNETGKKPGSYQKRCIGCNRVFMYRLNYFKHIRICTKNTDPKMASTTNVSLKAVEESSRSSAESKTVLKKMTELESLAKEIQAHGLPPRLIPFEEVHLLLIAERGDSVDNGTDTVPKLFSFSFTSLPAAAISSPSIADTTTTTANTSANTTKTIQVEKENNVRETNQSSVKINFKLNCPKTSWVDSNGNKRPFAYLCDICQRGFIYKGSFDKHVEDHRQKEGETSEDSRKKKQPTEEEDEEVEEEEEEEEKEDEKEVQVVSPSSERFLRKKPESEKVATSPDKVVPKIKIVTSPVVGGSHQTLNHVIVPAENSLKTILRSPLKASITSALIASNDAGSNQPKPIIKIVLTRKDHLKADSSDSSNSPPPSDQAINEPLFKTTLGKDGKGIRLLITSNKRKTHTCIVRCQYCDTEYRYAQSKLKHEATCYRRPKPKDAPPPEVIDRPIALNSSNEQSQDDQSEENSTAKANEPRRYRHRHLGLRRSIDPLAKERSVVVGERQGKPSQGGLTAKAVNEPAQVVKITKIRSSRSNSPMPKRPSSSVGEGVSLLEKNNNIHSASNNNDECSDDSTTDSGSVGTTTTPAGSNQNSKFIQNLKQNILGLQKRISLALKNIDKEMDVCTQFK